MKRLKRVERGRNCSLSLFPPPIIIPRGGKPPPCFPTFPTRLELRSDVINYDIEALFFTKALVPASIATFPFFFLSLFFFLLGGWKWKSCSSTSGGFCLALNGVRGLIGYGWTTRRDFWWRIRFVGGRFYVKLGRDCGGWYLFRNFSLDQSIICLFPSLQDLCVCCVLTFLFEQSWISTLVRKSEET